MDFAAKVSSKGQTTVPKVVRDALGIEGSGEIVFRLEGNRAVCARTPDCLDLAGAVELPAADPGVVWGDLMRTTRAARGTTRH
jgi:AbrB family looped-hinge helix DNA binding protein